jgi:predicted transcriptional regulator
MQDDSLKSPRNPTPAELQILRALWRAQGSTVRELQTAMPDRTQGYTTLLKMLQIMHEKGLVLRHEDGKAHRYSAAAAESEIKTSLVSDLMDRAFEGAAQSLVLHALEARQPSREELAEIRRMIDRFEAQAKEEMP